MKGISSLAFWSINFKGIWYLKMILRMACYFYRQRVQMVQENQLKTSIVFFEGERCEDLKITKEAILPGLETAGNVIYRYV